MTTTVYFQLDTAAALDAWEQTLAGDPLGAPALRRVLLSELKQRLVAADGLPDDRRTDAKTRPPTHFVQLDGRTWVQYVVRDKRTKLFGRTRRVIIIGLGSRPAGLTTRSSGPG